ncbi:hypothetical protein [Anoxybacter fermentans]|nr:hypothetical protein [Anoxybacter fermentans]
MRKLLTVLMVVLILVAANIAPVKANPNWADEPDTTVEVVSIISY